MDVRVVLDLDITTTTIEPRGAFGIAVGTGGKGKLVCPAMVLAHDVRSIACKGPVCNALGIVVHQAAVSR